MDNNDFENGYRPEDYNPFTGRRENEKVAGDGNADMNMVEENTVQEHASSGYPNYGNPYQGNSFNHSYRSQNGYAESGRSRAADDRTQAVSRKPKKKGTAGKIIKTMAKTVAIALVFGLVSGTAFYGINRVLNLTDKETIESSEKEEKEEKREEVKETPVIAPATGYAGGLTDVSGIVEQAMPSIVAITNISEVTYQSFWGMQQSYETPSAGSGIIIDQTADYLYIATNNHVVENAKSLSVQFINESTVDAEIRGTYPSKDLAVVQVKKSDIDPETMNIIKVATVGDSAAMKVGQPSIAIGNALGYGQSVTTGIISAKDRTITVSDSANRGTVTNSNLLQTDAAINPGNSGGALLNAQGQVIGINSAKYSSTEVEGVGYAIPMEDALPIIQALIKDGDYVNNHAAYLGVSGADITSAYAQTYKMPEGIYVVEINDRAQAIEAGLHEGDIITAIDKKKVGSMDELKSVLVNYKAGDTVKVHVSRQNGRGYDQLELNIKLMSAKELNISAQ